MLDDKPSFARIALNRTTFGAREADVAGVERSGWTAWVEEQLRPPTGDDPQLAAYMASQRLHYKYPAGSYLDFKWPELDEFRPFTYLYANVEKLWRLARGVAENYSFGEQGWPRVEHCSAIFIRNAHSKFQLREFMTDFWINHFNIGRSKATFVENELVAFERDVIRPNVFGNFRQIIEGVTKSPAMLIYLDNADSTAALPNENYARELMELHTMGEGAYLGKVPLGPDSLSNGFTDADVLQAARALSGWTLEKGQIPFKDSTGNFTYYKPQHNTSAGICLGFDLSTLTADMAQGQKVLDLVAYHPATPIFVCTKICRRIFGDTPPEAVVTRAVQAWTKHRESPDQIAQVLRAILLEGPEVGTGPAVKVRRPYERLMALWRATDTIVNANLYWTTILGDLNDSPFVWPTPNGRPDVNSFWLNTFVNITTWQYMRDAFGQVATSGLKVNLKDQTPVEAQSSIVATVDYWVGRMVGYSLSPDAMKALYSYASNGAGFGSASGPWSPNESDLQNMVIAIAAAPEFVLR
ncbi:MAG: DUF1800 domain-containing protein [Rhodospirillaceae bacterium]|nr:DUF1800 domain-containing protein [Rhodospirillaceae bacterium]